MIKVKNNKENTDTWSGMMIESGAYYEIEKLELTRWQNNSKVLTDIASGDLIINDGNQDILDIATAVNLLLGKSSLDVDAQGRQVTRIAAGQAGWAYFGHPLEFETSKFGSLYEKKNDLSNRGNCSIKFYNENNDEVIDDTYESTVVKTVVLFKPSYDYEILAGSLQQIEAPTSDLRMWVTGGIIELGGPYVKEFIGGINLRYFAGNESLKTDGRAAKYMRKDITGVPYQANQLQIVIRHDAGVQHKLMLTLEYFRA